MGIIYFYCINLTAHSKIYKFSIIYYNFEKKKDSCNFVIKNYLYNKIVQRKM